MIYAAHREDVVDVSSGKAALREVIGTGATIEFVEPKQRRAEFEQRLSLEDAPRRRGRPKLDRDWTRKKLDSAAALGDDETHLTNSLN